MGFFETTQVSRETNCQLFPFFLSWWSGIECRLNNQPMLIDKDVPIFPKFTSSDPFYFGHSLPSQLHGELRIPRANSAPIYKTDRPQAGLIFPIYNPPRHTSVEQDPKVNYRKQSLCQAQTEEAPSPNSQKLCCCGTVTGGGTPALD